MEACMTPTRHGLTNVVKDSGSYVDGSHSAVNLCLQIHFKLTVVSYTIQFHPQRKTNEEEII